MDSGELYPQSGRGGGPRHWHRLPRESCYNPRVPPDHKRETYAARTQDHAQADHA